jgi:hypothetical protein
VGIWLIASDANLLRLFTDVAEDGGIHVTPMHPDEADRQLSDGLLPAAAFVTRSAIRSDGHESYLAAVPRVVVASARTGESLGPELAHIVPLLLPSTLDEVGGALRWLAWEGAMVPYSAPALSEASSSRA